MMAAAAGLMGMGASGTAYATEQSGGRTSCAMAQAKGGYAYGDKACAVASERELACYREAAKGAGPGILMKEPRSTAAGAVAGCAAGVIWP